MRITLVDDDPSALFFTNRLLSRMFPGSSIAMFTSPAEALAHIVDCGADLLITDHGMGGMSGTELIQKVRERHAEMPIIMISGNPDAREEAMAAGANVFVPKSLSNLELEKCIRNLVAGRR